MAGEQSAAGVPRQSQEFEVLAAAFYAARFAKDWQSRPYWMMRRCVAPYVAVRQFLVLRRDGLPVAFAGWACEREDRPTPWREDRYMPSAAQIQGPGPCIITDIISGFVTPAQIAEQVGRYLGSSAAPPWIEWYPDRRIKLVHAASQTAIDASVRTGLPPSGE